eukprot:Blabericola_migrator_1__13466@NODE_973_length_5857_cov_179_640933_g675_i0_p3_GENE_NODE_973_length_5857_cov_179_640933_g675_i0NODE_973_length_5857_cov_179_640933_g675_i0_p3_ORF_typecomplete_len227_score43_31ANAPC5/PF12862_7/0_059ANAPC5/PF12862_7/3_3e03SRP_TPR_like/PF17004_5/1_6SRP_TPR_like/PF17004_5/2_4e02_NODE_973_length_5857_cov_179_640933_g675_i084683
MIPVKTLLGFLDEGGAPDLKRFSLKQLNLLTPHAWFEIADSLQQLEHYYFEVEKNNECRELSALLLSQIHYNLEEYPAALKYGLYAKGELITLFDEFYKKKVFNASGDSYEGTTLALKRFLDMIVALTLDEYIRYRSKQMESALSSVVLGHGSPTEKTAASDPKGCDMVDDEFSVEVDHATVDLFVSHILALDPKGIRL